jgi:hypothetical protein
MILLYTHTLKSSGGEVGNLADNTSHPPSVIKMVCSNYADLYPSAVTYTYT